MIDFRRVGFSFPPVAGRAESQTRTITFPSQVIRADSAINGFDLGFSEDEHPLFRLRIDSATSINQNTVTVTVLFSLRDNSGTFDDKYNGYVDVLVIAERN